MAFFGRQNNKFYGVGLYLLAVWILYGRKEVLPRSVVKEFKVDTQGGLKEKKRDPKVAVDYTGALAGMVSGKTMFEVGKAMKEKHKAK